MNGLGSGSVDITIFVRYFESDFQYFEKVDMDAPDDRAERLRRAMGGRTQAWLAEQIGVATSSINGYLKGKVPQADVCLRMCDALAIDIRWYMHGDAPREHDRGFESVVQVPFIDEQGKALTYTAGLLEIFNVPFETLVCMAVRGSMMSPGIPLGAEMLATTEFAEIIDGEVYILRIRDSYVVRRIKIRADACLVAVCDNPAAMSDVSDVVSPDSVVALALWCSHRP